MNPLTERIKIGTVGELLVQLRLLQYEVQAAPPIKDSGNDLIAIKGNIFRAIQVKTTTGDNFTKGDLMERKFHILAVVHLTGDEETLLLDDSTVFLIPRDQANDVSTNINDLMPYAISSDRINTLFH